MNNFLKIFSCLLLLTVMISCGGDEDKMNGSELFEGTWLVVAIESETSQSITFVGETVVTESKLIGSDFDYEYKFNESDFTITGSFTATTTTILDGVDFGAQVQQIDNVNSGGDYRIDGNKLIISNQFGTSAQGTPSTISEDIVADWVINSDDELIISQSSESNVTLNGTTNLTISNSLIKLIRK